MKILDNHVHTHFSRDAKDTMEDVIKRAINIGVDYLRWLAVSSTNWRLSSRPLVVS